MTVPLEKLLAAARNAPRRSFPDHDCKLDSKIEYLLEGTWDVTDLIEMQVDEEAVAEISTTAAAGSGTERPLGKTVRYHDDQMEKLVRSWDEYVDRGRREHKVVSIREWIDEALPGVSPEMVEKFRAYLDARASRTLEKHLGGTHVRGV